MLESANYIDICYKHIYEEYMKQLFLTALLIYGAAHCDYQSLDSTFGGNGVIITSLGTCSGTVNAVGYRHCMSKYSRMAKFCFLAIVICLRAVDLNMMRNMDTSRFCVTMLMELSMPVLVRGALCECHDLIYGSPSLLPIVRCKHMVKLLSHEEPGE